MLIMIVLVLLMAVANGCKLDSAALNRITQDLSVFNEGITPEMMQTAKETPFTCIVIIQNHTLKENSCLLRSQQCLLSTIARQLPDLEFVVNKLDQPRVFKNPCEVSQKWTDCACDKGYILPNHGFFFNSNYYLGVKEKAPIFSPGTVSSCFSDILMPSHLHLQAHYTRKFIPWSEKDNSVVWRGSTTGGGYSQDTPHFTRYHRQRLVSLCQKMPDCDAKFSSYGSCGAICLEMR